MAIHYDIISNDLTNDIKLLRLNFHILVLRYVDKKEIYFTKVKTEDKVDKENEDNQVAAIVSNLE